MWLSCNAPASLWDEFCLTAVYLSNFTITSANNDKTPFQLWYNRVPSLSHLQEIGCCAFALINTNNPKIFQCSTPCMLPWLTLPRSQITTMIAPLTPTLALTKKAMTPTMNYMTCSRSLPLNESDAASSLPISCPCLPHPPLALLPGHPHWCHPLLSQPHHLLL